MEEHKPKKYYQAVFQSSPSNCAVAWCVDKAGRTYWDGVEHETLEAAVVAMVEMARELNADRAFVNYKYIGNTETRENVELLETIRWNLLTPKEPINPLGWFQSAVEGIRGIFSRGRGQRPAPPLP